MEKGRSYWFNLIFFIQVLVTFLFLMEDRIQLPAWLQVAGRMHPMVLHLPIGFLVLFILLLLVLKHEVRVQGVVLLMTSLTMSVAALCGFFLSREIGYDPASIQQHKVSGLMLSWVCYLMLAFFDRLEKKRLLLIAASLMGVALLFVGHTGSVITHGEDFLLKPVMTDKKVTQDNSSAYQFAVEPILNKKCFSCHNESKMKGKLDMTSVSSFMKGGEHGQPWNDKDPAKSYLLKVLHLPLTHDEHMPPDGKTQLSEIEKKVLEVWVYSGAGFEKKLNDLDQNDSLRIIATSLPKDEVVKEVVYSFKPASLEKIEKLNTPFRTVAPLFKESPALRADFYVKETFQEKSLEELEEVKDQLAELNLAHMPITNKNLTVIGKFKNLETLNLNFTEISGGLAALQPLKKLRTLSLSGTAIEAASLKEILSLPELKEFFGWNTRVNAEDQEALIKQFPNVTFTWSLYHDTGLLKLSKPAIANESILKKSESVILKHTMPGTTIRYTVDGTDPDSVKGQVYTQPFPLEITATIKACATKEGWLKSDVYQTTAFKEGFKPNEVELLSKADKGYPAEGAKSLTDGKKGFADLFKEPAWMGFTENPLEAGFTFTTEIPTLKYIVISYGKNTGGYIFPPTEVRIFGGSNKKELTLIKKINPVMPEKNESSKIETLNIPLSSAHYAYYKIIMTPIAKLPKWHSGKGKKGWIMVDEIFFN